MVSNIVFTMPHSTLIIYALDVYVIIYTLSRYARWDGIIPVIAHRFIYFDQTNDHCGDNTPDGRKFCKLATRGRPMSQALCLDWDSADKPSSWVSGACYGCNAHVVFCSYYVGSTMCAASFISPGVFPMCEVTHRK